METNERTRINNELYHSLDDQWYEGSHHPIALLRAENALRNPWIAKVIEQQYNGKVKILDIGCGGGLLTNSLAKLGHEVFGVDLSLPSLKVAAEKDATKSVVYKEASAYEIPFLEGDFDVVCAMDLLEHVEDPKKVISEASRLLKKGGLFFFHTFNRNFLSYLAAVKGVSWVRNSPSNLHVYSLFIKPHEMQKMCQENSLHVSNILGVKPDIFHRSFWKLVFTRTVPKDFRFVFTPSLMTGYSGYAIKN